MSGCNRLVVGPTHVCGITLDLVRVADVAPKAKANHSSLSASISIAQVVTNLCVSSKVFLKHQVNWNAVCCEIQDLPWGNIWSADNHVDALNKRLFLLVGRYVLTKVIRVRNKE